MEKEISAEELEQERHDIFADVYSEDTAVDHIQVDPPVMEEIKKESVEVLEVAEEAVPVELQTQIDNLKLALDSKELRLKQAESRVGSLQNKYSEAVKIADSLKDAPTKEQIEAALKSQEKWADLEDDFPSFKLVGERLTNTESSLKGEIDGLRTQIQTLNNPQVDNTEQRQSDAARLAEYYPNFFNINKSADFNEWMKVQPTHIKLRRESDRLVDAVYVMDKYHQAQIKPSVQETRQKRLEMSAERPQGTNYVPGTKTDEELTEAELRARVFAEVYNE